MQVYFHLSLLISLLSIISLLDTKVTDLGSSVFIRLLKGGKLLELSLLTQFS